MNKQIAVCCFLATALTASLAYSDTTIVVDFGDEIGDSTGNVNNVDPGSGVLAEFTSYTSSYLIDTTGSTTTATLSISTSGGSFYEYSIADSWQGTLASWMNSNMVNDLIGSNDEGTTLTVTISGLTAGTYTLELLSAGDYNDNASGYYENITVNGSYADSEANGGTSLGESWDFVAEGEGYDDYLIWNSVVVDESGTITIVLSDVLDENDGGLALNGFSLTTVPEPAQTAAIFGGLAFLGLAAFRRRGKESAK